MILVSQMLAASVAHGQSTADALMAHAFSVQITRTMPTTQLPDAPRSTWSLRITSDGTSAWAVATAQAPAPTYVPPDAVSGDMDHTPDGHYMVWLDVAYAAEYDLVTGLASTCDVKQLHMLAEDGRRQVSEPKGRPGVAEVSDEMVWGWLWRGLGDATTGARHGRAIRGPNFGSTPLASTWEWSNGAVTFNMRLDTVNLVLDTAIPGAVSDVFERHCPQAVRF